MWNSDWHASKILRTLPLPIALTALFGGVLAIWGELPTLELLLLAVAGGGLIVTMWLGPPDPDANPDGTAGPGHRTGPAPPRPDHHRHGQNHDADAAFAGVAKE